MKQTIGDLWSRFTDRSNWKQEIGHWVLEIDGYVIATSSGIDDAEDPTCKWSIYRGKAEWASYCSEGVWSPVDYASESEARAAAWSTLVKIVAGPEWPHEPAEMTDDVFEFPADKAEREAREAAEK